MKCAALSFKKHSSINNLQFISATPKKNGASGISLLPSIMQDLEKLKTVLLRSTLPKKNEKDVLVAVLY